MLQTQKDQLILMDVRAPFWRALLLLLAIAAILLVVFTVRWYLGNTMAEFSPPLDRGGLESARSAVNLAPGDPLARFVLGNMERDTFEPERLAEAVRQFEESVKLSPYDYRYWLSLGRAREQAGDVPGSEKALRRAVELAPAYAYPRWYLGNLLFRANRLDEAFDELRKAGESHEGFLQDICNAAWYGYNNDIAQMEKVLGNKPQMRAALAIFLANKGKADDSLRVWKTLGKEEKANLKTGTINSLFRSLFFAENYRAALEIAREIELIKEIKPESVEMKREILSDVGQISNGSFENGISAGDDQMSFGWRVSQTKKNEIKIDPDVKNDGGRSLRITFNGYDLYSFYNVWQTVAVEPNTRYRLEFSVRTKDLITVGPPKIEVANRIDKSVIAEKAIPIETNDWQTMTIEFTSPSKPDGVVIQTNRIPCDPVCSINGTVWYDNFNLQRIGAGAENGGSKNSGKGNTEPKPTPAR